MGPGLIKQTYETYLHKAKALKEEFKSRDAEKANKENGNSSTG